MKKMMVFMVALLTSAMMITVARAEVCYQLTPFPDILRLTIQTDQGTTGDTHHNVFGNWISSSYSLPVVGARELNHGSTSVRRLGIHGTNNGPSFGGNPICSLDGIAPGGAWSLTCVGGAGARFTNSGSALTQVSCGGVASSIGGAEAGD